MTRGSTLIYHFRNSPLPDALSRLFFDPGFQPMAQIL